MKTATYIFAGVCSLLLYSCSNKTENAFTEKQVHIDVQVTLSAEELKSAQETAAYTISGTGITSLTDIVADFGEVQLIVPARECMLILTPEDKLGGMHSLSLGWKVSSPDGRSSEGVLAINPTTCSYSGDKKSLTVNLDHDLGMLFSSLNQVKGGDLTISIHGTAASALTGTASLKLAAIAQIKTDNPRFELF